MIPRDARPITLDELAAHTGWIGFLLGLKPLPHALEKTAENVLREYGHDKWGGLLEKLRSVDRPAIDDADRLQIGKNRCVPCYADGGLYVADFQAVQNAYFNLIRDELQPLVERAGHLVELGAGYGSILLRLASVPGLDQAGYTAGEYADTGVACINLLAAHQKIRIQAGQCDLSDLKLETFAIPENAVFMTCWAMAYVKGLSRGSLEEIRRYKPAVVVHIEPTYEHWSDDSLQQMLWKSYCRLNDYNQSMLTALRIYETEGLIDIIEERRNLFGSNPLAPVSIVKWKPRG